MIASSIKALTFDLYGTLVDWRTAWISAAVKFMPKYKRAVDYGNFCDFWRAKTRELSTGPYRKYAALLRDGLVATFQNYNITGNFDDTNVLADSWDDIKPFPDTNPALNKLRSKYKLAIISNTDNIFIKRVLPSLAVSFDIIMTSEEAQAYKPTPKIYHDTLNLLRCSPSETMHVARTQYDVFAAKSLGMKATWVNRDREEPERKEIKLDFIVTDLEELVQALEI